MMVSGVAVLTLFFSFWMRYFGEQQLVLRCGGDLKPYGV